MGRLVEAEDLQQRLVEVPVRDLLDDDVAEARVVAEPAADADVHRLDELPVDLLEHALDADVGDLMLRAARRAAREVQAEVLAVAVGRDVLVEERGDLLGAAALRPHLRQPAELLARARLQRAVEERRLRLQLLGERLGEQVLDPVGGDPRQQHVLLVGQAHLGMGAVLAGEADELEQLARLQAADRDAEADRGVLAVVLGRDADVVVAAQLRRLLDAAAQLAAHAALELLAEGLGAHAVEDELEARLAARLPVLVAVAEDRRDVLGDLGGLLGRDEDVDPAREAGRRRQAAADADVEAGDAVLGDRAGQREVVDQAAGAVLGAARDRDLVLAREVRIELVPEEVLVDGLGGRLAVDELLVPDPRQRAADDVARDVAARAGRGQPDRRQAPEDLRNVVERDPVDLEALARRAVDDPAAEVLGDRGHDLGLIGGQDPPDDLRAEDEVAGLAAVRVDPVPLQEHQVIVGERLPALARGAHQVRVDVESVLLELRLLDLVHPNKVLNPIWLLAFFSHEREMVTRGVALRDLEAGRLDHGDNGGGRENPPPIPVATGRIEGLGVGGVGAGVGREDRAPPAASDRLGGEQQRTAGQLVQALQREERVGRVVEHARAPDDVVDAGLRDGRRVVEVALDEAHVALALLELLRRRHDVERGHARGARLARGEGDGAIDRPHRPDVEERAAGREPRDELLARRAAPPHVTRAGVGSMRSWAPVASTSRRRRAASSTSSSVVASGLTPRRRMSGGRKSPMTPASASARVMRQASWWRSATWAPRFAGSRGVPSVKPRSAVCSMSRSVSCAARCSSRSTPASTTRRTPSRTATRPAMCGVPARNRSIPGAGSYGRSMANCSRCPNQPWIGERSRSTRSSRT